MPYHKVMHPTPQGLGLMNTMFPYRKITRMI